MSPRALGILLCSVGLAAPSFAQEGADGQPAPTAQVAPEAAPAAEAKPQTEVPQSTEAKGTFPQDIGGRYFVLSHVRLPSGFVTSVGRLLEIRRGPEHLEVVLERSLLPEDLNTKLQQASSAGKPWEASPEDLKMVAESWDKLAPSQGEYESIENKILGADAYPKEFNIDQTSKDSKFAIVIREGYAGTQALTSTYSVFAVRDRKPEQLIGTFVMSSIAAAPLPIPITLKGDFIAYRVGGGDEGGTSLLARIFGIFSGCGR